MQQYFQPWIGKNYSTGGMFEIPILILGESIYEWEDEKLSPDRVVELVRNNATGLETHKFYTNLFLAFTQKQRTVENKRIFWDSVSHFNYIISPIQGGPRIAPTSQMVKDAKSEFFNRIEMLGTIPSCVIVLGKRLWGYLPEQGEQGPDIVINDMKHRTLIYNGVCQKQIYLTWIYHPSVGFSSNHWYLIINKFITMVKDKMA